MITTESIWFGQTTWPAQIMYTSINPYLAPLDGMAAEDAAISTIDTIISMRAQDRGHIH